MAQLATQTITRDGVVPSFTAAAAGGDTVVPGPTTFLHVRNGGAGAITVTIDSVKLCSFGSDHNVVVNVAAGADAMIGPIDAARFAQPSGLANVTYSGVTTVSVGARAI